MFTYPKIEKYLKKIHPPKFFGKKLRRVKELLRDPFSYLGIISFLLFVSLFFIPFFKTLPAKETPLFLSDLSRTFSQNWENKDPFLSPANRFLAESPDFLLVEKTSLRAATPPALVSPQVLGALVLGYEVEDARRIITEYIVESGDSLWQIAEKFNISLETVLWANNLNKNSIIQPGQKLVIPPVSGVIHHVKSGDTISEIAQKYKGKVEEIVAFNQLSSEGDIYVGDVIIVPNGVMPAPVKTYPPKLVPLASSYFICPVAGGCHITQGLHWYNAVDLSNGECGEPILAAAGGRVLKVKLTNSTSRWAFSGAGNHLTILHPNGVVTTYAHLLTSLVNPGQEVSQGQIIGLMGGQPGTPGAGHSTGCHLHFGVSGAKNPFAK